MNVKNFGWLILFLITSSMVCDLTFSIKVPEGWPKPFYNFERNPLTKEKVLLGRYLFYDPILSANNTISCASCHSPYNAFTHADHALSHGIYDSIGTRNSPTLINLAWHPYFMWDGAINHLDMQALAPITNPIEMGENLNNVLAKLRTHAFYRNHFQKAWKDTSITGEYVLKSLSQFVLTLVSNQSKYDSVTRNETEFNPQEKRGYLLFKKNCNACHAEPLFTNLNYESNGLKLDSNLNDFGRMRITRLPSDSLKFKVPTLRNIEFSFPYMHDGRFKTLKEVLNHYEKGIPSHGNVPKQQANIFSLSSNEKADLMAFLLTLTDRNFLFKTEFAYPR